MNITWWTSTPYAPWQNGSAERFVKMAKTCLMIVNQKSKSLYDASLRFREAESIFNSRPVIFDGRPISAFELCFGRPPHFVTENLNHPMKTLDLGKVYRFNMVIRKHIIKLLKLHYFNNFRLKPKH